MNGPISMYKLKPVVQFAETIEITPTIYSMKNIYRSNYLSTSGRSKEDPQRTIPNIVEQKPSVIENLEKRQQTVLKQLNSLKEQMSVLREELSKKNLEGTPVISQMTLSPSTTTQQSWNGVSGEVVLHSSPDRPPYSLLAVSRLWPSLRLQVTSHCHSSLAILPPHLGIFNSLATTISHSPAIHVRLVWKQMGPDCELVISPLSHTPIRGEVNLLRYLRRSMSSSAAVDATTETQLDSLLDTCHRLSHSHTQRDKQLAMRALNARLGKCEWLAGKDLSIADVAAWSVLRAISGAELSQNLTKWRGRCAAAIGQEVA